MKKRSLKANRTALIKAFATGDLSKVQTLRENGVRVHASQEGLYEMQAGILDEHLGSIFSRQINPDLCSRVVTFNELRQTCGPFYRSSEALFSLGDRPEGWASLAFADRILSWSDDGFGILGDQVIDVAERLVSSKPMSAYADAIIAGPLPDDLEEAPEGFIAPDLHAIGIKDRKLSDELFCKLYLDAFIADRDLEWTKNFPLAQFAREALRTAWPKFIEAAKKSPKKFGQVALYAAAIREDESASDNEFEVPLADSGRRQLAIIRMAQRVLAAAEAPRKRRLLAKEVEKLHAVGREEKALKQISSLATQAGKSPVTVEELESYKQYFRRLEFPVLSTQIEILCGRLALSLIQEADDAGQDELLPRVAFCGWRPPPGATLQKARRDESGQLLRQLLKAGMSPHGHASNGINFSALIGEALNSNPLSVEILLKAGADPLEPTHYGGATTLEHVRWTVEESGTTVDPALAKCLELLEAAAAGDPRSAWM
jgi:hypothetical protein